uniref:Uncharacterized protein n=1 Tax=Aureoumbra lagunensis TaxID=44058 RepID=A0A7S3NK20_9STRA|mmetsp:Transcript_1726/g.2251  ORF Transcript_1726/g.2251 Transcript_1726/m.2251 type:complete len:339 (+) Transcript_1726:98-1114(+)
MSAKSPRRESLDDESPLRENIGPLPIELVEKVCTYLYDCEKISQVNCWPVDRVTSRESVREESFTPPISALESDCASYYIRNETYGLVQNVQEIRLGPVRVRGFWTDCLASEMFPHIRVTHTRHRLRKFMCIDEIRSDSALVQYARHCLAFRSTANDELLVYVYRPGDSSASYSLCGHVFPKPRTFVYIPSGATICRRLFRAIKTTIQVRLQLYEFLPLVSCWGHPSPSTYLWVTPNARTNRLPIFTEYQDGTIRRVRRNAVVYNSLPVQTLLTRVDSEVSDNDDHFIHQDDASSSSSSSSAPRDNLQEEKYHHEDEFYVEQHSDTNVFFSSPASTIR